METRKRSVLKGITYRIMATIATALVAYGYTGSLETAVQIGGIDFFLKLSLYYLNDRLWNKFNWGIKHINNIIN